MLASQVSYSGVDAYCSNAHAAAIQTDCQYSQYTVVTYKLYL